MPQVDFYVLTDNNTSPERFACKLINKAWTQGNQIYVHTASRTEAERFDDLLWTFRDSSFLPHSLAAEDGQNENPIVIGWKDTHPQGKQVMLSLTPAVPAFATEFARIIEIVAGDQARRQQARERYRHYRVLGCDMHQHSIDSVHD